MFRRLPEQSSPQLYFCTVHSLCKADAQVTERLMSVSEISESLVGTEDSI